MVEHRLENCDSEAAYAMNYKLDPQQTKIEEEEREKHLDRAAERAQREKQDLMAMAAEMERGEWLELRTARLVRGLRLNSGLCKLKSQLRDTKTWQTQ